MANQMPTFVLYSPTYLLSAYLEQVELDRLRLERLKKQISWEDELKTSLAEETRYERLHRLRRRAWNLNRGSR